MLLRDDLQKQVHDKPEKVVFVVGTGIPLGAVSGAPCEAYASWVGLIRSGLERALALGKIPANEFADSVKKLGHTRLGALLETASAVEELLGAPNHGEFRRWLRETVGTFEANLRDDSVLKALTAHQRRGALLATTNYDLLLEHVTGLDAVTWRDVADVDGVLRGTDTRILHLHGAWRWPDTVVLGIKSYGDVAHDSYAQTVLTALRTDRTFVFVGCGAGLRDPNLGAFLRWTAEVFAGAETRHFRLCRDSEVEAVRAEHPDGQRIFPLAYGPNHADLAPFLRSLLPHGTTSTPPISPPANPATTSTPAIVSTHAAARPAVSDFDAISTSTRISPDGLEPALGTLTPPQPSPSLPPPPPDSTAVTLPQFALVLDRTSQWLTLTNILRDESRHALVVVHGDNHQDIGLFIQRTLRWANGMGERPPRSHEIIAAECYHEGRCPRSKSTWAARVLQAIAQKRIPALASDTTHSTEEQLHIALAELAGRAATLLVFVGQNGGGLRDAGEGMKLVERNSFADFLKELVNALPTDSANPIRILVPIEHAPDKSAKDLLFAATRSAAGACPQLLYVALEELDFPKWSEVRKSLEDEFVRRRHRCEPEDLERLFRAAFDHHSGPETSQAQSFAALGKALSEILDSELTEEEDPT